MKLQSMTAFVEDILEYTHESINYERGLLLIQEYYEFLKQPLTLGMFIPCDEEGNILEEPPKVRYFDPTEPVPDEVEQEFYDYLEAKEKVLFEGFEICKCNGEISVKKHNRIPLMMSEMENMTIEDLIKGNLTLTPNAIKQIGL